MTSDHAEDRARVEAILIRLGADPADLPEDLHECAAMASDLVLAAGESLTLADLARATDAPAADIGRMLRHLGVPSGAADDTMFVERDVELARFLVGTLNTALLESERIEMLHLIGTAVESIAEAAVASHVQGPEQRSPDPAANTELNATITQLGLELAEHLPAVFRHHLRKAALRQRRTQSTDFPEHVHLAVGFLDLVGFTSLSQTLTPSDLVRLVKEFETEAHELAHRLDARVVKLIGDEVMFVAETADAAAAYATGMIHAFSAGERADSVVPRGGIAMGALVNLHGDYFGPVVNLAARLVDAAVPGEVLVTQDIATDDVDTDRAGRRMLRGFDAPTEVWSLI